MPDFQSLCEWIIEPPINWQLYGFIATIMSAFAAGGSALAAFWVISSNYRQKNNELHLKNAVQCLERAYGALTQNGEHCAPPLKNRLAWLTAARLIEEFKDFKHEVKNKIMKKELFSHEEHWRQKFFAALSHSDLENPDYYSSGIRDENTIEPRSAIILHAFADWPDGHNDYIGAYKDTDDAYNKLQPSKLWLGLRIYIDKLD